MDRFAFLRCQPWLEPCAAPTTSPLWAGLASFSFSLAEQSGDGHALQSSPQGAGAEDALHAFFAVGGDSSAVLDAATLVAELHEPPDHAQLVLLLDGAAFELHPGGATAVTARTPSLGEDAGEPHTPPYVSLLMPRVTLTLVPRGGTSWASEAPLLLAAARALEAAKLRAPSAPPLACARPAPHALRDWNAAVDALAASCCGRGPAGALHASAAQLADAVDALRGRHAQLMIAQPHADEQADAEDTCRARLDAALRAAFPSAAGELRRHAGCSVAASAELQAALASAIAAERAGADALCAAALAVNA